MDTTDHLQLPFILPSQAQKHVTHNDALAILDTVVQLGVLARNLVAPPISPVAGDRYIVAAGATGAWAGKEDDIACFHAGIWHFTTPQIGWLAWCEPEGALLVCKPDGWITLSAETGGASTRFEHLGIGTDPDPTKPLALEGSDVLFNHAGQDFRATINKADTNNTASIIFQQGFSGRAEIGLCGGEELSIKVSPDGATFHQAISVEPSTGEVSFPKTSVPTDCIFNLLGDSGRFAGSGETDVTIGAFAFPGSFETINGANVSAHSKFIFDNNDHGGTGGWLSPETLELLTKIRKPGYRRYGLEFWVAQITHGGGTGGPINLGGVAYYECLFNSQRARLAAMTFHCYMRALDQEIAVRIFTGQTAYKDGLEMAGPIVIQPSDGWVSLAIADRIPPDEGYGYTPATIDVYCQANGNRWLLAAPVLTPGISKIPPEIGVVTSVFGWQ